MVEKILSIGIAVHNIEERYLKRCIESVLKNLSDRTEVIIVDDGSEGRCEKICKKYCRENPKARYIRNEKNMGIGAVRNTIIKNAHGKWVCFVDGDDFVSDFFADEFLRLPKDGLDVVLFDYDVFKDESFKEDIKQCEETGEFIKISGDAVGLMAESALLRCDLYKKEISLPLHTGSVWAAAYRAEFLKSNNILFDTRLKIAEDSVFNTEVYLAGANTAMLLKKLYFYRRNMQSATNRYDKNAKKTSDMYLKVIQKYIDDKFCGSEKIERDFLKYRCCGAITDSFERDIFHKDNPKPRRQRKRDFLNIVLSEPYKTALAETDIKNYENHSRRLALKLAKKRCFWTLDFIYKHDLVFKIYGTAARRIKEIKK